jgi:ATP-dependent protease Clp ATPase subunit
MATIECSFCGTAQTEETRTQFVAGPKVFICRGCVDMMIEIFRDKDPQWGEEKIKVLQGMQNKG